MTVTIYGTIVGGVYSAGLLLTEDEKSSIDVLRRYSSAMSSTSTTRTHHHHAPHRAPHVASRTRARDGAATDHHAKGRKLQDWPRPTSPSSARHTPRQLHRLGQPAPTSVRFVMRPPQTRCGHGRRDLKK